jgi:hypothetical protein
MGAGIPGTGMATLFYVLSVAVMLVRELMLTVQGRSDWARWRQIARHTALAGAMVSLTYVTFLYLPRLLLLPDATFGDLPALLVTVVLFVCYMVLTNVAAAVAPRPVQLPKPKFLDLRDPGLTLPAQTSLSMTSSGTVGLSVKSVDTRTHGPRDST